MKVASLLALALLIVGCGKSGVTPAPHPIASHPIDPWVLSCYDPAATEPALLWNGRVGLRFGRDGGPFGSGNRRLPMFMIDRYVQTGEQKIVPFENPLPPAPDFLENHIGLDNASDYRQTLDMRAGALVTSWSQPGSNGTTIEVKHTVVVHPTEMVLAEQWEFSMPVAASTSPNATAFPNEKPDQITAIGPDQIVAFDVTQASSQDSKTFSAHLERVVDLGARQNAGFVKKPTTETFDQVLTDSKKVWTERWKTDIEIDGPAEDQLAVRSFMFYLRSAIAPDGKMSVSPFGLSNATYSGHVFWDADIWVFPALAIIDPQEAAAIPKYRLAKLAQAQSNFDKWFADGRATASGKLGIMPIDGLLLGAMYPWESSVTGSETVPGPSQFEHHITGSVAFSVAQAASLGLVPQGETNRLLLFADAFYKTRSVDAPGGRLIESVMSPDESHVGDNDLYTNLLAEWLSNGGNWSKTGKTLYKLPKDDKSFLTYDGDGLRSYKQAAAILSIYPLQYPPAVAQAKTMMDRFASKVIKNGPAMSDSVNAIIYARLGETDKAYSAWKNSWQPFTNNPLNLFSEKRNRANSYFITGAAGSLQSVLCGFLGIALDSSYHSKNDWSKQLLGDRVLSVAPHLPKSWRSVKFKNFTVLGRRYTLTATQAPNGGTSQITQGD